MTQSSDRGVPRFAVNAVPSTIAVVDARALQLGDCLAWELREIPKQFLELKPGAMNPGDVGNHANEHNERTRAIGAGLIEVAELHRESS
ncbi:MAG: hypothetical protein R2823_04750 [Acidimicrobiia bacterium]